MPINNDIVVAKHCEISELSNIRKSLVTKIKAIIHENWLHRGGCATCRGRGWVVAWDTLDSMTGCYADYTKCPNENCTASTVGPDASQHNKYDDERGVGSLFEKTAEYENIVRPLDERLADANVELNDLQMRYALDKGAFVEVKKGRKVPIGTTGVVVGFSSNQWGTKCCIKDANGKVHWTSTDNVCVIDNNR